MIKVGVIFGGKSGEHEVSIVSAESIMTHLARDRYEVVPIGITKDGQWITDNPLDQLKRGIIQQASTLPPSVLLEVDIVFPVLHGPFGEDGKIQGMFEMLNIPYVGAGALASALGMDKAMCKAIWDYHKLPVVPSAVFSRQRFESNPDSVEAEISKTIGFPCFIKPANLGSSVGISKVKAYSKLRKALSLACEFDQTIIAEVGLSVREIEIGVIGNYDQIEVSVPGEVLVAGEFYDFYDKYIHGKSSTKIVDDFSALEITALQDLAKRAFQTINGCGLARVDFFLEKKSRKLYLNELNTMPGFTSISMFPKLWEASGLPYPALLEKVIDLGFEHFKQRSRNKTTFESGSDWFKE